MNALLSFIEKLLVGIFILGFGVLIVIGLIRYNSGDSDESGSWRHVKKQNTIEAYLDFLRDCQSCPHEEEAGAALDELQRPLGLVVRLDRGHLGVRASIGLPVFSPDGRTVLAFGGEGPDFWDVNTGARLPYLENTFNNIRRGSLIEALAYAADGKRIAAGLSGAENGRLMVWDRQTGELVAEHLIDGYDAHAVAFAPQGSSLLGWLAHGPLGIWEPDTGKFLRATHEGASTLAFIRGEDGRSLLLSAAGRDLWYWDPGSMELHRQAVINSDRPLLGLSQDGRLIAYSEGPVIELWSTRTGAIVATLSGHDGDVMSFCREPKKGWIAIGTTAGTVYLWDTAVADPLARISAHEGPIQQLACSARGRMVSIGWDSAKVWDLEKLRKAQAGKPKAEQ